MKRDNARRATRSREAHKAKELLRHAVDHAKPMDALREKSKTLLREYGKKRPDIFYRTTD